VNDPPTANPDNYSVDQGGTLVVNSCPPGTPSSVGKGVLCNDTDDDSASAKAVLVTGPSHATAFTLNPDGSFTYTPVSSYFGQDSFTYKANDGVWTDGSTAMSDDSSIVTVTITVNRISFDFVAVQNLPLSGTKKPGSSIPLKWQFKKNGVVYCSTD